MPKLSSNQLQDIMIIVMYLQTNHIDWPQKK